MRKNDEKKKTSLQEEEKKPRKRELAEFLASSPQKRKNAVVVVLGNNFPFELRGAILSFLKKMNSNLIIHSLKDPHEIQKLTQYRMVLVLFDDSCVPLEEGLEILKNLKDRSNKNESNADIAPVLFLTRDPENLIKHYHQTLSAYHEADDYLDYPNHSLSIILGRMHSCLQGKARRRSRRYRVNMAVECFDQHHTFQPDIAPTDEPGTVLKYHPETLTEIELPLYTHPPVPRGWSGRLVDLSRHGALITSDQGLIFKQGQKFKIKITLGFNQRIDHNEFLSLYAKVQRVFINGTVAGLSFEGLSETQIAKLTKFLTELVEHEQRKIIDSTEKTAAESV